MSIVLLVHKSTIKIHHISPLNVHFQIDIPHNLFALYMINFRNEKICSVHGSQNLIITEHINKLHD